MDQATKDVIANITKIALGRGKVQYRPKDKEEPEENDAEKSEHEPNKEKPESKEKTDVPRYRNYMEKATPSRDGDSSA